MRVVVLGGSGAMGGLVADVLEGRGHEVLRASRATGVDVLAGDGLADALRGANCVVDCLNAPTLSREAAVGFFGAAARGVASTARALDVPHVVAVSIVNVARPAVARAMGYYAGKAAQEEEYARASVPVTLVRTTAWFTLAELFLHQVRVGPVAVVPRMRLRPVHPQAAADLVADTVEAGPTRGPAVADGPAVRELAGPEELTASAMARAVAARSRPAVRVLAVPAPSAGLRRGLLPGPGVPTDARRFTDWVRSAPR